MRQKLVSDHPRLRGPVDALICSACHSYKCLLDSFALQLERYVIFLRDAWAAIDLLEFNAHLVIRARREDHFETETLQKQVAQGKRAWERCCEETEAAQLIIGRMEVVKQMLKAEVADLEHKLKDSEGLVAELIKKEPKGKVLLLEEEEDDSPA
jgi:hypothetical protein